MGFLESHLVPLLRAYWNHFGQLVNLHFFNQSYLQVSDQCFVFESNLLGGNDCPKFEFFYQILSVFLLLSTFSSYLLLYLLPAAIEDNTGLRSGVICLLI